MALKIGREAQEEGARIKTHRVPGGSFLP